MTYMLESIDEAIDRKFLVIKKMKDQVEVGSVIHVVDTQQNDDGTIDVAYVMADRGDKFNVRSFVGRFNNIAQFCNWARPDKLMARHSDSFSNNEIQQYVRISNRTFKNFCAPIMCAALIVIWALAILLLDGVSTIVFGICLTVLACLAIMFFTKKRKDKVILKLYSKLSLQMGVSF